MPKRKPVPVYPVEGRYITGVPHVAHECSDPFCVESGAFTLEPPTETADHPRHADPADRAADKED